MRLPLRTFTAIGIALPAIGFASLANAQNYSDLPPLTPMSEAEVRSLPVEYRTAPAMAQVNETRTVVDGVETITRTRRIDLPAAPRAHHPQWTPMQHTYAPMPHAPVYAPAYAAPVVFERDQWIEECRRRTRGRNNDDTGLIIGGLLGAIAGGVAGYEIAGAGDRVLGSVLGAGGGGLIGGLLGSLIGGGKKKNRYDCEAALDGYLSQYGTPGGHIAYPAYGHGYPAGGYSYGYAYAPQQTVLVPVRTEVQQQVVVRETVREERYTVPGAVREIPSAKMIKTGR